MNTEVFLAGLTYLFLEMSMNFAIGNHSYSFSSSLKYSLLDVIDFKLSFTNTLI